MKKSTRKNMLLSLALSSLVFATGGTVALSNAVAQAETVENKGTINVYLIGGQSNAVGYGEDTNSTLANSDARYTDGFDNVLYYGAQERSGANVDVEFQKVKLGLGKSENCSGAEIGIASALGDTDSMNAVIKCAWGATHIYPDSQYDMSKSQGTWTSPSYIEENNVDVSINPKIGRMYEWFVETVTTGITLLEEEGYTPVIKGMWWMQGEAEMFSESMSSLYDELLTALIKDVREDVSKITCSDQSEMPFVFGLPSWNDSVSGAPAYENAVRANMQTVANNADILNVSYVDCDNLTQHDNWHFDAASQKYLGEQFISQVGTLTEGQNDEFKESISLFRGAKIRTNDPIGIRFGAKIADYNVDNGYKYGMMIIPTDYLTTYKSQIEAADYNYVKAFADNNVSVENMPCYVNTGDSDSDGIVENYIQGSLVNIKYANLNRPFTGIAYIYDETTDTYLYTSASVSRSVSYVASVAMFDYQETDAIYAGLKKYVNGGINQKNGVAEENGYETAAFTLDVEETLSLDFGGEVVSKNLNVVQSPAMGYCVRYTSENEAVAKVDANGNVIPVAVGETTVTVKCLNVEKTVNVTVDYITVDGMKIDGVRDENYGDFTDTVLMDNGRYYNISAVKTENGVFVYTQALFNTSEVAASWGASTDFEFKLNEASGQSYVALGNQAYGVSQYVMDVQEQGGKYLHTLEFFADKSLIRNWSEGEDVQLNYAWKSPSENAYVVSDMMYYEYITWNTNWHSYQRLGGLSTYYATMPANLFISEEGLTTVSPESTVAVIDGNLTEYGNFTHAGTSKNGAKLEMAGKAIDGDLYLAIQLTHDAWTSYTTEWWKNDNFEIYINGAKVVIMFFDGKMILPSYITQGATQTTTNGNGQLVTTVELYVDGNSEVYRLKVGMNGEVTGWCGLIWDGEASYVGSQGISATKSVHLSSGITLDGNFTESVWTQEVKNNVASTTANGASISIIGRKTEMGVLLGATVTHTKAPSESVNGETNWWNYMNVEFRFNNGGSMIATCLNARSTAVYSYCATTQNGATYTSNFEIFVSYADIGVTAKDTVNVAVGGWYETAFAWLWGANDETPTHMITENGFMDRNNVEDDVLKILTIGNSFSDDTMEYIGQIAESLGVEYVLANMYIPACDIDTHWNNVDKWLPAYEYRAFINGAWVTTANTRVYDVVKKENWDYISFQQASGTSGVADTYGNLNNLVDKVRGFANANAKIVWNMTWAYQSDSTHGAFVNYNNDQMTMYNAIVETVQTVIVPNERFDIISPTGTAIQNARASALGDTLTRDGYHLEYTYGRYLAGLTFFYALTGMDITEIEFAPAGVNDEVKAICIEAAVNAVKTPYSVTK